MIASDAAASQIAEDPTTVVINGEPMEVWLGPVTFDEINGGAGDYARRQMVAISDNPPEGAVGVDGELWTIASRELPGGKVTISTLVKE